MKKLTLLFCLISLPALADDKPPIWTMAVQLKASTLTANYPTEAKCKEAQKLIAPYLKHLGRADCLPVMPQ
jgi:hypothetical protein